MPLLGELSRSSQDLFESDSDSNESRDVRLDSPKSGVLKFSRFFQGHFCQTFDSIDSIFLSIQSTLCPRDVVDRPAVGTVGAAGVVGARVGSEPGAYSSICIEYSKSYCK